MDTELRAWNTVAAIFTQAAAYAVQGQQLPADLKAKIKFLIGN